MSEIIQADFFDGLSAQTQTVEVNLSQGQLNFTAGNETYFMRTQDRPAIEQERDYLRMQLNSQGAALVFKGNAAKRVIELGGFGKRERLNTRAGRSAAWTGVILVGLLLGMALFWRSGTKWTVDRLVSRLSFESEVTLSQQLIQEVTEEYGMRTGHRVNTVLARMGRELDEHYGTPKGYFKILIMDDFDMVNAFALPGGIIMISRPALGLVSSPQELTYLIGHEAGHLVKRHGLSRLVRSAIIPAVAGVFFGDVSGLSAVLVDTSTQLSALAYDRREEIEADLEGARLLHARGMDPASSLKLMEKLTELTGNHQWLAYVTSHPAGSDRLVALEEELNKLSEKETGDLKMVISPADWAVLKALASQRKLGGDTAL